MAVAMGAGPPQGSEAVGGAGAVKTSARSMRDDSSWPPVSRLLSSMAICSLRSSPRRIRSSCLGQEGRWQGKVSLSGPNPHPLPPDKVTEIKMGCGRVVGGQDAGGQAGEDTAGGREAQVCGEEVTGPDAAEGEALAVCLSDT